MSVPEFDPNAGLPAHLYIKIADHIAARIDDGELKLKPGEVITEVAMAECYPANRTTVRHAFRVLRDRYLIKTLAGTGSVILTKSQRRELREHKEGKRA